MENTQYLKSRLESIHWPCWQNQYSNTVLFKRPSGKIVAKYNLACGEAFGQKVSHIVVMQHVTKKAIDMFHALGVMTATIDLGVAGKVALW